MQGRSGKLKFILEWSEFSEKNRGEFEVFANSSGDEFWGDAGAGILPICSATGRVLVAYRSKYVNEPHTWGVFGGKLDDPKETPEEAAKRELTEESGYEGDFEIVPAFVFKTPNNTFEYHNFIGVVEEEFNPTFDWETESAKWVTLAELKALRPKHFGLKALMENSMSIISKYAK